MAYQSIPPGAGSDPWITAQTALLRNASPALTRFQEIKLGPYHYGVPPATADDNDSLQVGGGVGNAGGAYRVFGTSIFQTPKTTAWGICFRTILTAPANTKFYSIGIVNAAGTNDVAIVSLFGTDPTNNVLEISTGASQTLVAANVAAVSTIQDYALTSDATTIKAWRNGTVIASTTTFTNVNDEPMFPGFWGTDVNTVKGVRIFYGYIGP